MSNQESPGGVSRRALLKSTALGSLALAAGGLTLPFTLAPRRGGSSAGYRRQHPHCLGRLLG
ncbi:anaerobic dimethyl sulfoxide reductase subunit A [Klebsiella pneumoniae subsp. rhinoscleromatis]|nr:anaerobic dimethyl sulfoxide reductase subunit A [Klebsiella pneumoniae subsp. rhinoscleromatis]